MVFSKTIQMYIFDGNPNGRIMCELSNWNGRVYKVARTELSKFSERVDAENTGIYFLFGKSDENNETIYIGESERVCSRLRQHIADENFWSDCVVVLSKDDILNKAHVKYLENKFYTMVKNAARAEITNVNVPTCSSVSEYDEAMLEEFISNTKLLVNTLGYKVFEVAQTVSSENFEDVDDVVSDAIESEIIFSMSTRGSYAKGKVTEGGFLVFKGAKISDTVQPSIRNGVRTRERLEELGIIQNKIFVEDYVFSSPSMAANIICGYSINGRTAWKTSDNKTLKDIQEELAR